MLLWPLFACTDPENAATVAATPASPWDDGIAATVTLDGQVLLAADVGGAFDASGPLWFALDTGADRMYVDEELTRSKKTDLTLGPVTLSDVRLEATSLLDAESWVGWDLAGLAGQPLFQGRIVVFDYPRSEVHFFDEIPAEAPTGSPGTELPFTLNHDIPLVDVDVGGGPLTLIADTGSGVTLLTEGAFEAIDDGSLPRLGGYLWATVYGSDDAFLTRLPSIAFGEGGEIEGTWAVIVPDDNHLLPLLASIGLDVDGFLGFPFYREMVWAADGVASRFVGWKADDRDHIAANEWRRVGIEPRLEGRDIVVGMVYDPSDAADKLAVGDRLLSVDGSPTAGDTLDGVKARLRGEPGTTVSIETDRGELSVAREDLLPEL